MVIQIEEARADLFGLYYIADQKLLELGLLDSKEAYKAQYYSYMMNGLLTQQVRNKTRKADRRVAYAESCTYCTMGNGVGQGE